MGAELSGYEMVTCERCRAVLDNLPRNEHGHPMAHEVYHVGIAMTVRESGPHAVYRTGRFNHTALCHATKRG